MEHTQYEANFKDSNESTYLDEAGGQGVWVPDILIVWGLDLEIVVDGVVWDVASTSCAVPVTLSEADFIGD
jgi:hypothetical protein